MLLVRNGTALTRSPTHGREHRLRHKVLRKPVVRLPRPPDRGGDAGSILGARRSARRSALAKRSLDLVVALLVLVALAALLLAVALLVKLDSRGPVLFRQRRLGRKMQPLTMLKFRTMYTDTSSEPHWRYIAELVNEGPAVNGEGLKKLTGDPRVTRVGRVLRKLSIDELPQLLHVVMGQMSLVGPRPALEYEIRHYAPHHFDRFTVLPGITGHWQVSGRSQLGFQEMLDLDAEYASNNGFLTDLRILARTPRAAIGGTA
jgi:lipopolysaccharide/colanic/teichoic acid biosynthesis glycosyltransferase